MQRARCDRSSITAGQAHAGQYYCDRLNSGKPHFAARISAIQSSLIPYQCGLGASWTVLAQVNDRVASHYTAVQVRLDPYSLMHNSLYVQYQARLRE